MRVSQVVGTGVRRARELSRARVAPGLAASWSRAKRLGERGRSLVPSQRWRAVLQGPIVAALWLATYQQAAGRATAEVDSSVIALVTSLVTLPLLARSFQPLLAWIPVTFGTAIVAGSWPVFPAGVVVSLLAAVYAVGTRCHRLLTVATGLVSGLLLLPMQDNPAREGAAPMAITLCMLIIVAALADQVQVRRRAERTLAEREAERVQERARRAVLEERARIAREMHDVVAHHMSMIAVQAETAPFRIGALPEAGRRDFAAIGETAREALTEMRRLLGVLRSDGDQPELEPQPGVAQLGDLVEVARNAGIPVRLTVVGTPTPLSGAVDLSAYRIAQEALSNAGRHARGAHRVDLVVTYAGDQLQIVVSDDGPARAATSGGGHGLLGMTERVVMLGGTLDAGPRPGVGFEVRAVLPAVPTEAAAARKAAAGNRTAGNPTAGDAGARRSGTRKAGALGAADGGFAGGGATGGEPEAGGTAGER